MGILIGSIFSGLPNYYEASTLALLPLGDSNPVLPALCGISNGTNKLTCHGIQDTITIAGGSGISVLINSITKTVTIVSKAINGTQPKTVICPANQFFNAYDNATRQFTCAIVTGGGGSNSTVYDTIQNIGSPANASVYAGNTTKTNFTFKRFFEGSNIHITNGTQTITISANGWENNTASNLGTVGEGFFGQKIGIDLQFKKLLSIFGFTITSNSTTISIQPNFKINNYSCPVGQFANSYINSTGYTTCGNPSLSSAITSINSQSGPAVSIVGQSTNITVTNSTNQIKIGIGSNVATLSGSQTLTNKLIDASSNTISNIDNSNIKALAAISWSKISKSGSVLNDIGAPNSAYNLNSQILNSYGVPSSSTDVQRVDRIGLKAFSINCNPTNNQIIQYQSSNQTWICATNPGLTSAVISINSDTTAAQVIQGQSGNTTVSTSTGTTIIGLGSNAVIVGGSTQVVTKGLTVNALTLGGNEDANNRKIINLSAPTLITDAQVANHLGIIGSLVTASCSNNQVLKYQSSNQTWICYTSITGITSINSDTTAAQVIQGVSGNTTVSTSSGNTTINTGSNVLVTGGSPQIVSKQLTLNNGVLGGNLNVGSNSLTISGHASTLPSTSGQLVQQNGTFEGGLLDAAVAYVNSVDNSKLLFFDLSLGHSGTSTIIQATQKSNIFVNLPSSSGQIPLFSQIPFVTGGTGIGTTNTGGNNKTLSVSLASANVGHGTNSKGVLAAMTSPSGVFTVNGKNITGGSGINVAGNLTDITISSTGGSGVTSVSGTANNVTSSGGTTPTINLGSSVVVTNGLGQTFASGKKVTFNPSSSTSGISITTLGSDLSSPRQGDLRIVGSTIKYNDNANTTRTLDPTTILTSAITSINSDTTAAQKILRQVGNTTIVNATGQVTIGLGPNVIITGGSSQIISKGLTINSLTLGGDENANSHKITSLTTPTLSTDAQNAGHLGLLGSLVIGACNNGQVIQYQSSNTTWICATPATGTVTSVSGTANNVTSTGGATPIINLGSNVVVTNGVAQNMTVGKKVSFSGSSSTAPLNIGSLASDPTSPRRGDLWMTNSALRFQGGSNTTLTVITTAVTSINGMSGADTLTTGNSNNLTVTNNIAGKTITLNTGSDIVTVTGSVQNITKRFIAPLLDAGSFLVDRTDITKRLGLILSGSSTGTTLTQRVNQTTSQGINWPNIRETETLAIRPALNATTPADPAGTTSTTGVMTGMLAGFTPQVTGRIQLIIEGDIGSSAAADGAKVDARTGTGGSPSNGAALSGTVCGKAVQITAAAIAANTVPFTLVCQVTGLTVGTHIWIELGQYAITAGTATVKNISVSIMEI